MILTIRTTHRPATDLGFLLHKNPARLQSFTQSFGEAHVFYPEASDDACTAALLLDVDPVALVRGKSGTSADGGPLAQYVNDRPYVASSFLSVAISDVFGTAMAGRSKERPELADRPLPLSARVAVVPCRGGETLLRQLFEPLGYHVTARQHPLGATEMSRYFTVELSAEKRLRELLTHLYVLVPVLDDQKHYWVGPEEVEKLLRHGDGWLASHPERENIARRYLRHRRSLVADAIARLTVEEEAPDETESEVERDAEEQNLERPLSLNEQRLSSVLAALRASGAKRVLDLGCGEGRLLRLLLDDPRFEEIVGVEVSYRVLELASERLHLDRMPPKRRERIRLMHGSIVYRDSRLTGFDAAAVVEVIEHLDPPRLSAFERVLFEFARPGTVVITTPNVEYNSQWASLPAGRFRHRDHRFEWSRAQFESWCQRNADRFSYTVRFSPIGPENPDVGSPTQMAVFTRRDTDE
ncbi:MAG TPA: 3' terminal RNA ribose 2'-O-methyltransferase Hen1 [Gemmatimonadaceae bacterium]|nr:3' terminal RNA ribose 2'-O-methyltransferase Hen1 [Gemmatimonadaceae bacterium]